MQVGTDPRRPEDVGRAFQVSKHGHETTPCAPMPQTAIRIPSRLLPRLPFVAMNQFVIFAPGVQVPGPQ